MATVSHRIAGLAALRHRLATLAEAARAAAAAGLGDVAAAAADEARTMLRAEASPSAPGRPPADPGGHLAATITAASDPGPVSADVTVSAPEALILEYGTIRMAAHPFLRPAALKAGQGAKALLAAALRRGLTP